MKALRAGLDRFPTSAVNERGVELIKFWLRDEKESILFFLNSPAVTSCTTFM